MAMAINMEDDLGRDFTEVCHEIGLSPSTVISIFTSTAARERAIPSPLSAISSTERTARAYELSSADGHQTQLDRRGGRRCRHPRSGAHDARREDNDVTAWGGRNTRSSPNSR